MKADVRGPGQRWPNSDIGTGPKKASALSSEALRPSICCKTVFRLYLQLASGCETADELLDAGQNGLLIAGEEPMIGAVELNEPRLRDVAGEIAAGAYANGAVAPPVEHQRRNGNSAQKMPRIRVAQRLEHTLDGARARRSPEQAGPPGSCLRIGRQARRESLDAGSPAPERNELLEPEVILTGLQRVRIVGRRASLRQRAEQDEAGDTIGVIRGEFDAGRSALGRAEQYDRRLPTASSTVPMSCAVVSTLGVNPTRSDSRCRDDRAG